MKKLISVLAVLAMTAALFSCGQDSVTDKPAQPAESSTQTADSSSAVQNEESSSQDTDSTTDSANVQDIVGLWIEEKETAPLTLKINADGTYELIDGTDSQHGVIRIESDTSPEGAMYNFYGEDGTLWASYTTSTDENPRMHLYTEEHPFIRDNGNAMAGTHSDAEYSPDDLAGEWVQKETGNILTVGNDGAFTLKYVNGGSRFGTVVAESSEYPDSKKTWYYSFYETDGTPWTGFVCPEKPFDTIYSEDEGGMTFARNTSGKPLAPTVPEAKDMRDALTFMDRLMCSGGVKTDMDAVYTAADGTIYHKSVDPIYQTTEDVRNYLSRYMSEQFLSGYGNLFGGEHAKCIDHDGVLYVEYRPVGGIYGFTDEDPVIVESGDGYAIQLKNNNYGAEETRVIEVVKENGNWKINSVS